MRELIIRSVKIKYFRIMLTIGTLFIWVVSLAMFLFDRAEVITLSRDTAVIWTVLSSTLLLFMVFLMSVYAKKFAFFIQKKNQEMEREKTSFNECIEALCAEYKIIFYCNMITGDVELLRFGDSIRNSLPVEYSEKHPFEWYIDNYSENMVHEDYKEEFVRKSNPEYIKDKLLFRDTYTYTYLGITKGANVYYMLKALKVNGSENHILIGFMDVDSQVREAKNNEAVIRSALSQVEKSERAKRDFLSKMSSDLMSPLNRINVEAGNIIAEDNSTEPSIRCAKKILDSSDVLEGMINNILDLGDIEQGELKIEKKKFSINAALDEVGFIIANRLDSKNITLNWTRQIVHDEVIGDVEKIIDMFKHVIYTSIDSSSEGAVISASIIETQVLNQKAYFDIIVEDHGKGYSPDAMMGIFTDSVSPDSELTGLAITKMIAEMMGGKIELKSKVGEGTSVTLYLNMEI